MILSNLRFALRAMRKNMAFSSVAAITLALGIAATTTLFSIVDATILRPLPYADAGRLVIVWIDDSNRHLHEAATSYPTYQDWQTQNKVFDDLAFCIKGSPVTLTGGDFPERIERSLVSANLFQILGIAPLLGQTFSLAEEQSGERLTVLSYGIWQRRFGGAKDVVGRMLEIDGTTSRVVGVMPATFQFPSPATQLWEPLSAASNWQKIRGQRERPLGLALGRLKAGSSAAIAQANLNELGVGLADEYSNLAHNPDFAGFRVRVVPLFEQITGKQTQTALWVLFGAVVLVLLISCANVANLMLARGTARQRELGIRLALGASPRQVAGLLLTESVTLAAFAGLLGTVITAGVIRLFVLMAPDFLPRMDAIKMDERVLGFAIGVSVLSGFIFGIVPAWQASTSAPSSSLREGGRGDSPAFGSRRARDVLVIVEVSLAMILLCGSSLLVRSLLRLESLPLGFQTQNLLVFRVVLPGKMNSTQQASFFDSAIEHLHALPGVRRVGVVSNLFLDSDPNSTILAENQSSPIHAVQAMDDAVSPEIFSTLKVSLRQGRFFSVEDSDTGPHIAIINQSLATSLWPNQDPVGKRFQFGDDRFADPWVTVVGVVADMRRSGLERDPLPQVFLPFSQLPSRGTDVIVEASKNPLALVPTIRAQFANLDSTVPVYKVSTLDQRLAGTLAPRKFQATLFGLFAIIALTLSAVGLYGLLHYIVSLRAHELGIRIALGGSRSHILQLVLRQGIGLSLIGLLVGEIAGLVATRSMVSLVYGVSRNDPFTFLFAPAMLIAISILACLVPAWKASRLDPIEVLRS